MYRNSLKYFDEIDGVPSNIYYHYTSLEAFYNIISSRSLRLMSLTSSNDGAELYYKPENFISDFCETEGDLEFEQCFELLRNCLDEQRNQFMKYFKTKRQPYAFCLSSKKDNLTHWDRYADRCTGISVGFNVNSIDVFDSRMELCGFGRGIFSIGKALYSKDAIHNQIRNDLYGILYLLTNFTDISGEKSISDAINKYGINYLVPACMNIMSFAKKDVYYDEDELRIYHDSKQLNAELYLIESLNGDIDDSIYKNLRRHYLEFVKSLKIRDEKFTMTRRGIRGYHELCLNEIWGSGVIPEVILGPMCVQNKGELRRFLDKNGLKGTKIIESSVPIR